MSIQSSYTTYNYRLIDKLITQRSTIMHYSRGAIF